MKFIYLFILSLIVCSQVYADCGVAYPAQSVNDLQELIKQKKVREIIKNAQGSFYLHYEETCCLSGITTGDATIYQLKGEAIILHELCEASGPLKKKVEVSGETLLIREVAACGSGADESCDKQLPAKQKNNDKNPIQLKWDGEKFIVMSKNKEK